ncbi:MAG: DUF3108 domain-containing protein [Hyphomonadaceae bacterium]
MKALLLTLALAFAGLSASAEAYRLGYDAVVLGAITVGAVRYDVSYAEGRYAARASVRTAGAARLFDQTQISAAASGVMAAAAPGWRQYDLSHSYGAKFRRVRMLREAGGVNVAAAPPFGNGGAPPATPAQQRAAHDPVTALFALGMAVGAGRACASSVTVFDGRQLYRLSATNGQRGTYRGGGYDGPALRCALRYEPLAGYSDLAAARRNAPVSEAWFALTPQGGYAPLLHLSVPTPLGPARLNLTRYAAQ